MSGAFRPVGKKTVLGANAEPVAAVAAEDTGDGSQRVTGDLAVVGAFTGDTATLNSLTMAGGADGDGSLTNRALTLSGDATPSTLTAFAGVFTSDSEIDAPLFAGPLNGNATSATTADHTTAALTAGSGLTSTGTFNGSTARTFSIASGGVTNAMLAGSIAASKLVGSDIATVGTITSGVWNAGAVTSSGAVTGTGLASTGTGADTHSTGTTAQRPAGSAGKVRVNTDVHALEIHDGTAWSGDITAPTMANGWTSYGAGNMPMFYRKSPDGMVTWGGMANGSSATSGVMFTLPVGMRPATTWTFANAWGYLATVDSSGAVTVLNAVPIAYIYWGSFTFPAGL